MRQHPVGDIRVELRQALFREADVRPQQPVGMRELEALSPPRGFAAARAGLAHDFGRLLVLANALIGGVPKQAVARPAPQLDLRHELRLDPAHAPDRVGGQLVRERRGRPFQPLQLITQTARHRVLEAGPDPADVHEPALVVHRHDERADHLAGRCRGHVTRDDEFLALGALRLEPVLHTAGSVRLVLALRDDAFKAEAAGVLQHGLAVGLDVLAVADGPARRQVIEAAGQQRLAIDEGHVRSYPPRYRRSKA